MLRRAREVLCQYENSFSCYARRFVCRRLAQSLPITSALRTELAKAGTNQTPRRRTQRFSYQFPTEVQKVYPKLFEIALGPRRNIYFLILYIYTYRYSPVFTNSPTGAFFSSLWLGFGAHVNPRPQQKHVIRPCGPMDKASVYGTGDCRFESYQGHVLLFSLVI